ncbi:MAG TPA: pyruvate kinase [Bdellovibrionota bacterium]|nr:pyruvate kinase [Bdellovibrionota bacterium]
MNSRRTKIVATLGPATSSPKMIERLIKAGADVVRLNFSHGTLNEHTRSIQTVRALSQKLGKSIGVLADLPGPKMRTGELVGGGPVYLRRGTACTLTTRPIQGTVGMVAVKFPGFPRLVSKGDRVLLADGLLELKVLRVRDRDVACQVIVGGELKEHKGINLPGRRLRTPALSPRDKELIAFAVRMRVDFLGLSFVRRPSDIEMARRWMHRQGAKRADQISVIAKIENREALDNIDAILRRADGMMIARGDLGVEVPTAEVPVAQKQLIHLAAQMSAPVITATQMLESMINTPRPTRAEASDVANAIWDGTDAVMLSGETATGRYPVETVKTMARIIEEAESRPDFQWMAPEARDARSDAETVLQAAVRACNPTRHRAIVTYTHTGSTAIRLSKLRPRLRILALTPQPRTYRLLSLIWGVQPFISPQGKSVDDMIHRGDRILLRHTGLRLNDRVVVVAGTRLTSGATNILKIHQIGESL